MTNNQRSILVVSVLILSVGTSTFTVLAGLAITWG